MNATRAPQDRPTVGFGCLGITIAVIASALLVAFLVALLAAWAADWLFW